MTHDVTSQPPSPSQGQQGSTVGLVVTLTQITCITLTVIARWRALGSLSQAGRGGPPNPGASLTATRVVTL